MKAFWWFKENSIAGMARLGFNSIRWFDLPFDEAVMLGWLGQHSSGTVNLDSFHHHLKTYAPRIYKFHKLDDHSGAQAIQIFSQAGGVSSVLQKLSQRTQLIQDYRVQNDLLDFKLNNNVFDTELQFLKKQGIHGVISLTEQHHQKTQLQDHFQTHHLAITDLGAPKLEQAHQLVEIISDSLAKKEKLAVHCLAGIGRTSTMLMAAHILMGERYDDLQNLLVKQNPFFALTSAQVDFLRSLPS